MGTKWITYNGETLALDDAVHLFKIRIDVCLNIDTSALLTGEELEKADRFHRPEDKNSFLIRRYFLRALLGRFLQTLPADVPFLLLENKKPFIPGIEFNTSHSKEYAVIAISSVPVGIDIEYINREFDFTGIRENSFSEEEQLTFNKEQDLYTSFYTCWTRKEALLKASGEGLVDDLKQVVVIDPVLQRNGKIYQVDSFGNDNYIISLAYASDQRYELHYWDISNPLLSF